jgi:hypothetical protein
LKRVIATTMYDNAASMGVMRKLGIHIERNPYPDPPWLQVVGVLDNSQANGCWLSKQSMLYRNQRLVG